MSKTRKSLTLRLKRQDMERLAHIKLRTGIQADSEAVRYALTIASAAVLNPALSLPPGPNTENPEPGDVSRETE